MCDGDEITFPRPVNGIEAILLGIIQRTAQLLAAEPVGLWLGNGTTERLLPMWIWIRGHCEAVRERGPDAEGILIKSIHEGMHLIVLPLTHEGVSVGVSVFRAGKGQAPSSRRLVESRAFLEQAALVLRLNAISATREAAAVEKERERQARDLHDLVAQPLSGILLHLNGSERTLVERADLIRATLVEGLAGIQSLFKRNGSILTDGRTLVNALADFARKERHSSVPLVDFVHPVGGLSLESVTESHLFAIAAEATHNALRHADALRITIELAKSGQRLTLSITDDGKGFALRKSYSMNDRHFGISNMRSRARAIGARLSIRSALNRGTRVTVSLPARVQADGK